MNESMLNRTNSWQSPTTRIVQSASWGHDNRTGAQQQRLHQVMRLFEASAKGAMPGAWERCRAGKVAELVTILLLA